MTYAFVIPLIGCLFRFISSNMTYRNLLASSVFTFVLASFLEGIVEIAGTTTFYTYILLIAGLILFISSMGFIKRQD